MKSIVITAALLSLASLASATVVEIPLPGLLGNYQNAEYSTTIVLPGYPAVIHGASFRVSGTTTLGQVNCSVVGGGVYPVPMEMYAWMNDDSPSRSWYAEDIAAMAAGGSFSWTKSFIPLAGSPTWSFLMDGVGTIYLHGADPYSVCGVSASPSASSVVTEAVFIIDADFPILVEPSTWGKIKALYR